LLRHELQMRRRRRAWSGCGTAAAALERHDDLASHHRRARPGSRLTMSAERDRTHSSAGQALDRRQSASIVTRARSNAESIRDLGRRAAVSSAGTAHRRVASPSPRSMDLRAERIVDARRFAPGVISFERDRGFFLMMWPRAWCDRRCAGPARARLGDTAAPRSTPRASPLGARARSRCSRSLSRGVTDRSSSAVRCRARPRPPKTSGRDGCRRCRGVMTRS